jgi:hypothetical protein
MGQLENHGSTLWISGFGGVASADVNRRFDGALYARLNPPMETLVEIGKVLNLSQVPHQM